jgi:hypothetical protein
LEQGGCSGPSAPPQSLFYHAPRPAAVPGTVGGVADAIGAVLTTGLAVALQERQAYLQKKAAEEARRLAEAQKAAAAQQAQAAMAAVAAQQAAAQASSAPLGIPLWGWALAILGGGGALYAATR